MDDLPGIEGTPIPLMAAERVQRTAGATTSFDAGRGCPYQCSFCTIINVQGRKSRRRSPDDIEKIVRVNDAQGLRSFFITDDNFARNKDWEAILDRLIHLREVEKFNCGFIIQVDMLCHRLPNFIEKCARAGVRRVFIGLENINPGEPRSAPRSARTRSPSTGRCCSPGRRRGVITYAGYILGFPNDTTDSILHDIDVIKRELPVDLLEFFYLTPLPGSEDHLKLHRADAPLDPDMNKYDLNHVTTTHPLMSAAEWERAYRLAWQRYYTTEHIETVLRRVASVGANASNALFLITWFKGSIDFEHIHPLEFGFLRLKFRRDRRPSFPLEPAWRFYPRYLGETAVKLARWGLLYLAAAPHLPRHQARLEALRLHRCRHDAGRRRRGRDARAVQHRGGAELPEPGTAPGQDPARCRGLRAPSGEAPALPRRATDSARPRSSAYAVSAPPDRLRVIAQHCPGCFVNFCQIPGLCPVPNIDLTLMTCELWCRSMPY